jgi:hypothetical protein
MKILRSGAGRVMQAKYYIYSYNIAKAGTEPVAAAFDDSFSW